MTPNVSSTSLDFDDDEGNESNDSDIVPTTWNIRAFETNPK